MIRRIDFAPLDGITKVVFRQVWHRFFGGVDRYFIPFFSPTDQHIMTRKDLRELDPANNGGLPLVPQVMTRRAGDFLWAAEQAGDLGYTEVNLNLGCPSGTVTAKGKGAGFLAKPDQLDQFFDEVFSKVHMPVSVKTRLGIADPAEFGALLAVYDRYPIACLTIHARVQKEKYRGPVHLEEFAQALAESKNPVCYNGDLRTVEDVHALEARFPAVEAVMIGRGLAADPALAARAKGQSPPRETLRAFHRELGEAYCAAFGGPASALHRMKAIWALMLTGFAGGERYAKALGKTRRWEDLLSLTDRLLDSLEPAGEEGPGQFETGH